LKYWFFSTKQAHMKITQSETDEAVLGELGGRLARARLERNLTQAQLAAQAGVAKRTVERLEKGEPGTALWAFVRLCRALGFAARLDTLLPDTATPGPMELLAFRNHRRKRATGQHATTHRTSAGVTYTTHDDTPVMMVNEKPARVWKWGDEK
jgi:transcriptional regulator with XRE-family HTH domain